MAKCLIFMLFTWFSLSIFAEGRAPAQLGSANYLAMRLILPGKILEKVEFTSNAKGEKFAQYFLSQKPISPRVQLSEAMWKKWKSDIKKSADVKKDFVNKRMFQCHYQIWVELNRSDSQPKEPTDFSRETWCVPKNKNLYRIFLKNFKI